VGVGVGGLSVVTAQQATALLREGLLSEEGFLQACELEARVSLRAMELELVRGVVSRR
jgi:hypothetical protein